MSAGRVVYDSDDEAGLSPVAIVSLDHDEPQEPQQAQEPGTDTQPAPSAFADTFPMYSTPPLAATAHMEPSPLPDTLSVHGASATPSIAAFHPVPLASVSVSTSTSTSAMAMAHTTGTDAYQATYNSGYAGYNSYSVAGSLADVPRPATYTSSTDPSFFRHIYEQQQNAVLPDDAIATVHTAHVWDVPSSPMRPPPAPSPPLVQPTKRKHQTPTASQAALTLATADHDSGSAGVQLVPSSSRINSSRINSSRHGHLHEPKRPRHASTSTSDALDMSIPLETMTPVTMGPDQHDQDQRQDHDHDQILGATGSSIDPSFPGERTVTLGPALFAHGTPSASAAPASVTQSTVAVATPSMYASSERRRLGSSGPDVAAHASIDLGLGSGVAPVVHILSSPDILAEPVSFRAPPPQPQAPRRPETAVVSKPASAARTRTRSPMDDELAPSQGVVHRSRSAVVKEPSRKVLEIAASDDDDGSDDEVFVYDAPVGGDSDAESKTEVKQTKQAEAAKTPTAPMAVVIELSQKPPEALQALQAHETEPEREPKPRAKRARGRPKQVPKPVIRQVCPDSNDEDDLSDAPPVSLAQEAVVEVDVAEAAETESKTETETETKPEPEPMAEPKSEPSAPLAKAKAKAKRGRGRPAAKKKAVEIKDSMEDAGAPTETKTATPLAETSPNIALTPVNVQPKVGDDRPTPSKDQKDQKDQNQAPAAPPTATRSPNLGSLGASGQPRALYRVGLSKKSRIAPLLKIVRK